MAKVVESKKACAVNPLKMSQPLGASFAFLGLDACMPVMHGSQGCTSFGLVLLVRHFKEAIPLQTTAMNEVTTILGGLDNIEKAILNIRQRAKPQLIAICSTGLTETKGDDVEGYLELVRKKHPELADTALVYVSTPDYAGALHAYDKAFSFCEANDQASAGQLCRACATVVLLNIGRWDRAVDLSRTVVEDIASAPHARAVATGVRGLVLAMRGRPGPAPPGSDA